MSLQSVTSCKSKASDAQRMACTCILSVISVSPTTAFPSNMLTSSDREGNSQPEMSTSKTKSDSVRLPLGNTANCEPRLLKTTENVVLYASTFSCSATTIRRTSRSTLSPPKNPALQQHGNLIAKPRKCVRPPVLSQVLEIEDEDDLTRSKTYVYNSVKTHRDAWKQEEVEI